MFVVNRLRPINLIVFVAVLVMAQATAFALQQPSQGSNAPAATPSPASSKPTTPQTKKPWSVRVYKKNPPITVTVQAKDAPLTEVAAEIARQLGAPVILSSLMQRQKVTVEFTKDPIESAMRMLAPQVYIDYEVSGDASVQPKYLAIYLNGYNEPPPALTTVVRGTSEALIIEGNTEDGTEGAKEGTEAAKNEPLKVVYEKGQLSVRSVKQPLNVVLFEIASKMGIPFEMQGDSKDIVDISFSNYTLEQAVRSLASPAIRLYIRTDLLNYETRPLRLVLAAQAKT